MARRKKRGTKSLTPKGLYRKWNYKIEELPRRLREEQLEAGARFIQTDRDMLYRWVWERFWKNPRTDEWVYMEPEFYLFIRTGIVHGEGPPVSKELLRAWEKTYLAYRDEILDYWREAQGEAA